MFKYLVLVLGLVLLYFFWRDVRTYQRQSLIYEEVQDYAVEKYIKPYNIDSIQASLILAHQGGGAGNQYNVIMKLLFEFETGRMGKARTGGRYDGNKDVYPHGRPRKWLDSTFRDIYIPTGAPVAHVQKDGYAIYEKNGAHAGDNTPHYTYFDEPSISF